MANSTVPDSKVRGANMGPTRVLSASDGPHDVPVNLAIRGGNGELVAYKEHCIAHLWARG